MMYFGKRLAYVHFEKGTFAIISENDGIDLSKATINKNLSAVDFDSDGYIVRFSVLAGTASQHFKCHAQEQYIVYDIARNQLVDENGQTFRSLMHKPEHINVPDNG